MKIHDQLPPQVSLPQSRREAGPTRQSKDRFVSGGDGPLPRYPALVFQEKAGRAIDRTFNVIGVAFSAAAGGVVGALAGGLGGSLLGPAGGVIGMVGGAVAGALGCGVATARGHGDTLGKTAMAAAAVGVGAMLGSLGGPTGAVIGAAIGTAYAGAGLYFSRD